uniref:Uncharacterized protein n=1 Tax=Panagrolaimus sp. PS1159 TaxID=55785 RepID=A0AC35FK38_9BILA
MFPTTTTVCPNPCGAVPADATVLVSQMADASCMYTTSVSCVNPALMLQFNTFDTQLPPVTLTCNFMNPLMPFYEYPSITGITAVMSIACS